MGLFGSFFEKKQSESVVLIDIGAASVAGAYAHYPPSGPPSIVYARRFPIEPHEGEAHDKSMLRALGVLGKALIEEGAPALMHAVGSAKIAAILVSIDAPWQETQLRTESIEPREPFVFTKSFVASILKKSKPESESKVLADQSVIGTMLNGYETEEPYGKRARRASVIVLTSLVDRSVAESIVGLLRGLYHHTHIYPIAGSSLRYQALRQLFPHERDALILDATGPEIILALLRHGFLAAVSETPSKGTASDTWVADVTNALSELAKRYPLPHTIFLLARDAELTALRDRLDNANLGTLWLTDNPPKIVSILASHLSASVRQTTTATPDILLVLMALFWKSGDRAFET